MSLFVVLMHNVATVCGWVLSVLKVCIGVCVFCLLTPSGSALSLIVFLLDMLMEIRASTLSGRDAPYLNTGSQKCYIYGQVSISVRALDAGWVHLLQLRVE